MMNARKIYENICGGYVMDGENALESKVCWGEIVRMRLWLTLCVMLVLSVFAGESVKADAAVSADSVMPVVTSLSGDLPEGAVVVIPLKGEVSKAQLFFLRRIIKMGEASKASAFILDMDTPGGELGAGVDILQALLNAKAPTYTYVNPNAGSAGALIALGSKHIWMAPVSAIGAAAPVMSGGQEIAETMNAKIVSYYSGYFRSAAEKNGHNPEVAEAFINKDKVVKLGDRVLSEKGELLTLSAKEATEKINAKPVLAEGVADSIAALVRDAKLQGQVVEAHPSGFERAAILITMLAPLFLFGGIVGTYIEIKTPGFGVAGVIAGICFLLFFTGHYIAGLTGMEVVVVFVLGAILVLTELLFFPGLVLPAFVGVSLMLGSVLWAMVDFYPNAPAWPVAGDFVRPMTNLGIAVFISGVVIFFIAQFFPRIPVLRRLVLTANQPAGESLSMGGEEGGGLPVRAGDRGRVVTMLRPVGRVEFSEGIFDARSEGEFLSVGKDVVVLRVEGSEVVVECVRE